MTIIEVIVDFSAPERDNLRHIGANIEDHGNDNREKKSDDDEQSEPREVPVE